MANMNGMGNSASPTPSTQKTFNQPASSTYVGPTEQVKNINSTSIKFLGEIHSCNGNIGAVSCQRKVIVDGVTDFIIRNGFAKNQTPQRIEQLLLTLFHNYFVKYLDVWANIINKTSGKQPVTGAQLATKNSDEIKQIAGTVIKYIDKDHSPRDQQFEKDMTAISHFKNRDDKPLLWDSAIAELFIVIQDPNKKKILINACLGKKSTVKMVRCLGWDGNEEINNWLSGFLLSASKDADAILWEHAINTQKNINLNSSNNNSSAPISPGTELNHSNTSFGLSKSFSWQDLYVNGAVTQRVITDKKAGTGRDISIKIYTIRDPKTHQLSQQIGIFDYSNPGGGGTPSGIYGRRYPTGKNIDQSITLAPDGPTFHLTINNGVVTFTKEGDAKPQIKTTIAALTNLRLAQVQNQGYEEKIGDQNFKVMGQGGANGSLLLFPCDKNGNVTSTMPEAMADVNKLGPDGYVQNLDASPQKTSLGFFPPGIGQDGNPIGKFYYMKAEGQGNDAYFAPVVCDPQKEKEKCDFPPPPQPPTQQASGADQNSPAAPSGAPPANNQSSAGGTACELSAKDFPNPPVWNGWTFFPGENGIAICVGSHQITANGILKNIESKNGQLSLEMAISDADSKVDPKKLYADLNPNWDYEVSCPDNKTVGGEKLPCSASFKGIHFTKDERYFIPMEKIDKLSGNPPISELAAVRLEFNLNIKSGSIDPTEAEISANSQEGAKGAWENFVKTNPAANQYTQQVEGFIDSQEADSSSQEKILIHPFPGEIKNLGQDTPIVTGFNGKTLTVADLLNVKKDGSASQGH